MDTTGTESGGYWTRGFPRESVANFLQLAGNLKHTEIGIETNSYFKRYCTADELDVAVVSEGLKTLHVGATWSGVPRKAPHDEFLKLDASRPERRMFVVDLDLQDYPFNIAKEDQARNDRALPCVLAGVEILKRILLDTFGFEQTVTFYSGRRGAHLYVLDERAVMMTDEGRASVAAFFSISSTDKTTRRLNAAGMLSHPNFDYLYGTLVLPAFENILVATDGVGLLNEADGIRTLLTFLGINALKSLENELFGRTDGPSRWHHIKTRVAELTASNPDKFGWVETRLQEVVMSFVWPRADVAVSSKLGHLLKIPFGAHPSTGRIAVPIFDHLSFRPADVPTIQNYYGLQSLVAKFDCLIDTFKMSRGRKSPEPPPPSPKTKSHSMDIEDIEDMALNTGRVNCLLEFERSIHTLVDATGVVLINAQHRSPPPNRPRVHFLDDQSFELTRTRANERMPTPVSLQTALDAASQPSNTTGSWKRLTRYPVFYHVPNMQNLQKATEHHAALLERMNDAAETFPYIALKDPEDAVDILREQITPAFISFP